MTTISSEICCRKQFGWLCNRRELFGQAVEIGVCSGDFAEAFLSKWEGRMLVGIDHYGPYGSDPYDRENDRLCAMARMAKFGMRWRLCRERNTSELADKICILGQPDFVYIDGSHVYEDVVNDIAIWWPRLSQQGILAGHDYDERLPGVIQAVDEFAARERAAVYLTHEYDFPSWYIYKTHPAKLLTKWASWEL